MTDFGLAKADDQHNLTHTGDILGTLRYMPPEAFEGKTDARSDVYSLGLTLYELLAFRPAFDEKERNRLIKQVTTGEPPRLDKLNRRSAARPGDDRPQGDRPRAAQRRYATAAELAADLQRFLDDEPIHARAISTAERLIRWCRRNPLLAGSLTAVAATLVLGTLVAWLLAAWAFTEAERARNAEGNANTEAERARNAQGNANTEAERARRQAYAASLRLMPQAWESHNMAQAQARCWTRQRISRTRGFEWYYWQRVCHIEHLTLVGHLGGVTSVAFATGGQRLATGGKDGTARIWDANNGQELLCLRNSPSEVTAVAYAPGGPWLVTGSTDGTAKLWNVSTGRLLRTLGRPNTGAVWCVAVMPDGKRVVTGNEDGTARVWDALGGQELLTLDGRLALPAISVSMAGILSLPQAPGSVLAASALYPGRMGHPGPVWAIAVTPDGKRADHSGSGQLCLPLGCRHGPCVPELHRELRGGLGHQ